MEQVQIYHILHILGINPNNGYIDNGTSIKGICPCHSDADNINGFSFKYTGEPPIWSCWTRQCHRKYGNSIIGLICGIKKINKNKAQEIFKHITDGKDYGDYIKSIPKKTPVNYIKMHFEQSPISDYYIEAPLNSIDNRQINKNTISEFGLYSGSGIFSNHIVFQVKNLNKATIGLSGRNTLYVKGRKDITKWKHYPHKQFKTSINLFNIDRVAELVTKDNLNYVVAVESPFDAIKLHQCGVKNVVAIMGAVILQGQIDILKNLRIARVILSLDSDKAGAEGAKVSMGNLNRNMIDAKILSPPTGMDWDELEDWELLSIVDGAIK